MIIFQKKQIINSKVLHSPNLSQIFPQSSWLENCMILYKGIYIWVGVKMYEFL